MHAQQLGLNCAAASSEVSYGKHVLFVSTEDRVPVPYLFLAVQATGVPSRDQCSSSAAEEGPGAAWRQELSLAAPSLFCQARHWQRQINVPVCPS